MTKLAAIQSVLLAASLALSISMPPAVASHRTLEESSQPKKSSIRRTSVALPNGDCEITPPTPASEEVHPAFVASYPGSGASMVRVLVPALTGLKTGVIRTMVNETVDAVGLKTHYPQIGNIPEWAKEQVTRVVILIRNPMSSIPSYCNYLYESENSLGIHSEKAPTEYWLKWRDEQFETEMYHWENLIDYWMENENVKDEDRALLVYEDLTSEVQGSATATALARFFSRSPGVQSIDDEVVPCVWEKVVRSKEEIKGLRGVGTKRAGGKEREWTIEQLEFMSETLLKLSKKYETNMELVAVLNRYLISVHTKYQERLKAALERTTAKSEKSYWKFFT